MENEECSITVQVGRDIFDELNTDIGRDAIRLYSVSDFMNQMEYMYGVSAISQYRRCI